MSKQKTEKMALELPSETPSEFADKLEDGDMVVKARSLHKKFLPEPYLTKLAEDSVNQRVLWRHRDPENPEDRGRVYGRVLKAEAKDDFIESYYRIFGGSEDSPEAKIQELIKSQLEAGDPIGISKGYLTQSDKNGTKRVLSLEDSITYKPACKACKTEEVITQMEEDLDKKIKKLQEELNDTKLQLEEKEAQESKYKEKLDELEAKVETKESTIEEERDKVNKMEDKKTQLEDKLLKLSEEFQEFKAQKEAEKRKPLIDEIFKYEQSEILKDVYQDMSINKLEEHLEEVKGKHSQPQVTVTELEEEAKEELEKKDVGIKATLHGLTSSDQAIAKKEYERMKQEGVI